MSISPSSQDAHAGRYSVAIDQDQVAVVYAHDATHFEPFAIHPAIAPKHRLTKAERQTMLIKMAALRVCAGLEGRPLRSLALEIGCTHTAIDNAVQRICNRLGLRKQIIPDGRRAQLSLARRRSIASKTAHPALA